MPASAVPRPKEPPARGGSAAHRLRRRDAPATEDRILTAAMRLFAQHGFDAVSTKQLAAEAGVAIGALYHHFPSKDAIYAAATRKAFLGKAALPDALAEPGMPPERRLAGLVAWFIRLLAEDEAFGLLLKREMLDPRPSTPRLLSHDLFQAPLGLFTELIRELAPGVPVDEAVASMLALIFGFASIKGIHALFPGMRRSFDSPEEIADHAVRLILRGLGPPA